MGERRQKLGDDTFVGFFASISMSKPLSELLKKRHCMS